MNKLEEIIGRLETAKKRYKALEPSGDLGNLEAIARERAALSEQITLLEDCADSERSRIEAEEKAIREEQREIYINSLLREAQSRGKKSGKMNLRAEKLMQELVETFAEQEAVLSIEAIGLHNPERYELLSNDEVKKLLRALERSLPDLSHKQFSFSWHNTVERLAIENPKIKRAVKELVSMPPHGFDVPLGGVKSHLERAIRQLPKAMPSEHKTEEIAPVEELVRFHQSVDLRTR